MAGTQAFKGEMITYPPGAAAPEHHHVGAEHFQYVISGQGTAILDGKAVRLGVGDLVYNYEYEPHSFINDTDDDFVFVEFFVPGPCDTIWSPGQIFAPGYQRVKILEVASPHAISVIMSTARMTGFNLSTTSLVYAGKQRTVVRGGAFGTTYKYHSRAIGLLEKPARYLPASTGSSLTKITGAGVAGVVTTKHKIASPAVITQLAIVRKFSCPRLKPLSVRNSNFVVKYKHADFVPPTKIQII